MEGSRHALESTINARAAVSDVFPGPVAGRRIVHGLRGHPELPRSRPPAVTGRPKRHPTPETAGPRRPDHHALPGLRNEPLAVPYLGNHAAHLGSLLLSLHAFRKPREQAHPHWRSPD